jgi:hypothetical protein
VIIGTQPTDLYRLNARVEVKRGTRFFCSAVVGVGNLAVAATFKRLSRWVRQSLIAPLVYRLPASDKKLSLEFKLKRFLGGQDLSPEKARTCGGASF